MGWDTNLECHSPSAAPSQSPVPSKQQVPPGADPAGPGTAGLWGACSVLGERGQSLLGAEPEATAPVWAPSTATGIYCMCSYAPFLVQRFGISSELRETTAAAGLARDSSRAALDLWGSETLRKAERWSHIP